MWIIFQRLSMVLFTALSLDQILRILSSKDLRSDSIYSANDAAALLKVEKGVILKLIKRGDIKARRVKGQYKILGQNLKDFLSE